MVNSPLGGARPAGWTSPHGRRIDKGCSLGYYGFLVTERLGTSMLKSREYLLPFRFFPSIPHHEIRKRPERDEKCTCFCDDHPCEDKKATDGVRGRVLV